MLPSTGLKRDVTATLIAQDVGVVRRPWPLGVAPEGVLLPVGVAGTISATLLNVSPPSVDKATKTLS